MRLPFLPRPFLFLTLLCASCVGFAQTPTAPAAPTASPAQPALPTCPSAPNTLRSIASVQGSGPLSARVGQAVSVLGVVTGDFQDRARLHGFFMQQPAAARHAGSSEGIFVYVPLRAHRVAVGQYVQVSGAIEEYRSSSADTQRLTRIGNVTQIVSCGVGPAIAPTEMTLPVRDSRALEAREGMLVRFAQPLVVSDNHPLGYNGTLLLAADERLWQPHNHPTLTDPAAVSAYNARAAILLDDGANAVRPNPIPYLSAADAGGTRRVGDSVTGLTGILSWAHDGWRVQPTGPVQFAARNPRSDKPATVGGDVRVASMNVLNFFKTLKSRGADTSQERDRQRDKLVSAIVALDADALGLMEIENGAAALEHLVSTLNNRVGAPSWAAIPSEVQGNDAIKVAILYKPARLHPVGIASLPPGSSFEVDGKARPPLAQRFATNDSQRSFWLVVNHLKSKSSCPASSRSADRDRGQGCWNATRVRQAKALAKWVTRLTTQSEDTNLLMVGDFNSYLAEDPLQALAAAGFDNLLQRVPASERYTYVFDGLSGALDHALVSQALAPRVSGVTIWHINADEPAILDYNTENKPDDRYAPTPFRASDHDPVLVGLRFTD